MDNRIEWQDPRGKQMARAVAITRDAASDAARPLAAAQARALAVQRVNSFGKSREGVPMNEREMPQGWKISQVERLIELPRRDIQRACYSGQGGARILEPANSTWGKRFYSPRDIARLMLVKLYKDQGYCLPEIRDLLNGPDGRIDTKAGLSTWKARLEEELTEVELKLNRVLALLAALEDDDGQEGIQKHLYGQLPRDVLDSLRNVAFGETSSPAATEMLGELAPHLDKPGIDLAIDLWAGPGSYDRIVQALQD